MPEPTLPFLLGATPLALYAGFSDLKTMTIPNWVSVALLALFVVLGLIFIPFDIFLWRLVAAGVVLICVFILNMLGVLGGGDAKLIAASTPFVAFQDWAACLLFFSAALIITLVLHRIARAIPLIRRATPDWASWQSGRNFPMGISIAATLIFYLAARLMSVG